MSGVLTQGSSTEERAWLYLEQWDAGLSEDEYDMFCHALHGYAQVVVAEARGDERAKVLAEVEAALLDLYGCLSPAQEHMFAKLRGGQ